MELSIFKDKLFELLNENDDVLGIADIETDDGNNTFTVRAADGSKFELVCRQA